MGPTPMIYFAHYHFNSDAAVMVTGSHNPSDYNGFKMVLNNHSFYAEIADVIERFFYDVNIIDKPADWTVENDGNVSIDESNSNENNTFKICPDCDSKTLKTENGCDMCVECGYSKCDK